MNGRLRWLFHLANLAVILTGVTHLVMKFLMEPADEWAVVNHPWQPVVQYLHVLAAPVLVFLVGYVWRQHVAYQLSNGRAGRRSGLGLVLSFAPMAASGYLLQVSADALWRSVWSYVHLATAGLWLLAFCGHLIVSLAAARRPAPNQTPSPCPPPSRSRSVP